MGNIKIEERESYFSLENSDFMINISKEGYVLGWNIKNKGLALINTLSFKENINEIEENPEIVLTQTSSSLIFEKDFNTIQLKKVYSLRERSLIIDLYFITTKSTPLNYHLSIKLNKWIDYIMIAKNKFDIQKQIKSKAKDFLCVSEKQNIYFGCIFKEESILQVAPKTDILDISIKNNINLNKNDIFMLSYTFALV